MPVTDAKPVFASTETSSSRATLTGNRLIIAPGSTLNSAWTRPSIVATTASSRSPSNGTTCRLALRAFADADPDLAGASGDAGFAAACGGVAGAAGAAGAGAAGG